MEDAESIISRLGIYLSRRTIDGDVYLKVTLTYLDQEIDTDSIRLKDLNEDYLGC